MIIIKLQGGLGNQMFQYACGLSLSRTLNTQLFSDVSFFEDNQKATADFMPRHYELDIFNIKAPIAERQQVEAFTRPSLSKKIRHSLNMPYKKIVHENIEQGAMQLQNLIPPVYLDGYWQSEDYFKSHKSVVQSAFTFAQLDERNSVIAAKIKRSNNSVSMHIRRGDYLTNKNKITHGLLPTDYYYKALEILKEKYRELNLFVFSDDISWVKSNLELVEHSAFFVADNEGACWKDMALMATCEHHIIANSSFSWWGAWLNPQPNTTVIAPLNWFANEQMNAFSENIIPDYWIKI